MRTTGQFAPTLASPTLALPHFAEEGNLRALDEAERHSLIGAPA